MIRVGKRYKSKITMTTKMYLLLPGQTLSVIVALHKNRECMEELTRNSIIGMTWRFHP